MEEAKWYVAHTFSGYENKVASNIETVVENRNLHDWIQDVVVLIKMVMNDDSWYVVRNTRGCTGFVGPESKPVPLTEEEVRKLGVEKVTVEVHYAVGDLVNVIDGPLEGFSGTVDAIDIPNNSAQVTVSMFGRETSVDFELDQLEKVKD